ncbi:MAG: hypothetical protein WKF75_16350 [Singulisphaera sp.]
MWPRRMRISWPVVASQILTVWSSPPEASRVPSGLNVTHRTWLLWPLRAGTTSWPVVASQILTVRPPPEASRVPSRLKATLRTKGGWPG